MYAITSRGALVSLCDKPRYVRVKPESGVWVEASEEQAEALAVSGTLYNLPGGTAVPDAPEAEVSERDGAEFVFENRARIAENEESTGTAIIQMEDAMCEQDAANDQRMGALEDAVCELDSIING